MSDIPLWVIVFVSFAAVSFWRSLAKDSTIHMHFHRHSRPPWVEPTEPVSKEKSHLKVINGGKSD